MSEFQHPLRDTPRLCARLLNVVQQWHSSPMTVIPEWTLADRLRKSRQEVALDQRAFAEQLGVTSSAYAQWEAGRAIPRDVVAIAKRVQSRTGVDALWLLGLDERPRQDSNLQPTDLWAESWGLAA
jgi:DNA-binding XRE family transcriptional regulator